jgi:hypothetical protein
MFLAFASVVFGFSCYSGSGVDSGMMIESIVCGPGVNFFIILWKAFVHVDPKRVKWYWWLDWILTLLGATRVKAARKYVGEIDPRGDQLQKCVTA